MILHGRYESPPLSLVGRWKVTDTDGASDAGSEVTAEFTPDGRLTYAIAFAETQQLILLTWRLDGDFIVTDQPSQPGEVRTRYTFLGPDQLVLDLNGERTHLVRAGYGTT